MEITAYFDLIEDRLLSDALIATVDFVDRWQTDVNGYFRARFSFVNGQRMEFAEYVQRGNRGDLNVVTYAYQWMSSDNSLLCRWDNTPHFPHLPGFPFHRHNGSENAVQPDEPRTIFSVLEEIIQLMKQGH
jgi:hypothetical protein